MKGHVAIRGVGDGAQLIAERLAHPRGVCRGRGQEVGLVARADQSTDQAYSLATAAGAVVAAPTGSSTASSSTASTSNSARECARGFTSAVEQYRQTTFDKDADGFNALLAPDVSIIFADGSTLLGKEESAAWIEGFFADPEWTQTLDVVRTTHEGCRSGFVLFDSEYTPSPADDPKPLAIGVTFIRSGGECWCCTTRTATARSPTDRDGRDGSWRCPRNGSEMHAVSRG